MTDARVEEFVRLFNAGEFFAAHDVLEDLWLACGDGNREFYQGLVQVAVALEHDRRGNARGARGVLASASRHLASYLPAHQGLDIEGLLEKVVRHLDAPEECGPPRLEWPLEPAGT